jgi:hypothetical protein
MSHKVIKIRITKASIPTAWYNEGFINHEFSVLNVFPKCVEVMLQDGLSQDVKYYILNNDYIVIGKERIKSLHKHHGCISSKIGKENKNRLWDFTKRLFRY